jgi:antirestriction protein ArdC
MAVLDREPKPHWLERSRRRSSDHRQTDAASGEENERTIPFMKGYTVFNVTQIEGLPEHYYGKAETPVATVARIPYAEAFFEPLRDKIVHGGSRACYVPSTDNIHMPCIDFFRDAVSCYATLAHEATHNADTRIMPPRTLRVPE